MLEKPFYERMWDLNFRKKSLLTVLIFIISSVPIYYFAIVVDSPSVLLLLFLPLVVTSGFYLKKWNFFPPFVCSLSTLIISILYWEQQFSSFLIYFLSNFLGFVILFSIVGILIGHVSVFYKELRDEKNKETINRKEAEKYEELLHSLLRHDVRNKTQFVQGYLQLLEDLDLPEEAEEFVEQSKKGIQESMDIIEKVRSLKKDKGNHVGAVNVNSVIESAIGENESKAQETNMQIETNLPEFNNKVRGGSPLEEIFGNLIGNSIRHSSGGKIRIKGQEKNDEIVCTVEDDGEGIPDSDKEKIFHQGYTTNDEKGTGIGLFLVKKVLDIYGGDIKVKDSELGGAKFEVHLRKEGTNL